MANTILSDLEAQVARTTEVDASAKLLIDGMAGRIQAAVDASLANGATAAQLAPVTAEIAALKAGSTALADAVAANTTDVEPGPGIPPGGTDIDPSTGQPFPNTPEGRAKRAAAANQKRKG